MADSTGRLPSLRELHRDYDVYPTQAMVSAACMIHAFDSLEAAATTAVLADGSRPGWCAAESCQHCPGAGGVATSAVKAMTRYREHRDFDAMADEMAESWAYRTMGRPERGEGVRKVQALMPAFRAAFLAWMGEPLPDDA